METGSERKNRQSFLPGWKTFLLLLSVARIKPCDLEWLGASLIYGFRSSAPDHSVTKSDDVPYSCCHIKSGHFCQDLLLIGVQRARSSLAFFLYWKWKRLIVHIDTDISQWEGRRGEGEVRRGGGVGSHCPYLYSTFINDFNALLIKSAFLWQSKEQAILELLITKVKPWNKYENTTH